MHRCTLFVLLLAVLLPASSVAQSLKNISIEDLSKIDVTSVSKHAESIADAAAAISVVTSDDLRRSGVTELPDALRLAVGIAVARFNGETWGVSARGFNVSTANKMLVLIDGRSVYTPLFSGVFWGVQDIVLEDVDRIEVVRGPGGTLWGANAINGVINIITKSAAETQGGLVMLGGGSNLGQTVLRYGGKAGANAAYRAYGKYNYLGAQEFSTGASAKDPLRHAQAGLRLDWTPPSRTAFTLQGDAYGARSGLSDRPDIEESGGNILGRLSHTTLTGSQFQFQGYYDGTYRKVPRQFSEHRDTVDLDLQYRMTALGRHDLTSGVGYRLTRGRAPASPVLFFDPATRTSYLLNLFVQDEIALVPARLVLTLGSKIEHNDFTGAEYQPTARLRWSGPLRQTVWGAVSRAVRMPTRFDRDLRFMGGFPIVVLQGSPGFKSETVMAGEAGYRFRVGSRLAVDAAGFVNGYDDLRTQEPPAGGGVPITLSNNLQATTRGLELGVDYQAFSRWQLHAAYSRLGEDFHLKPGSLDPSKGTGEHNDPKNQLSIRSYLDLPGNGELDVVYRFVGALPQPAVKRYSELTVRGGWGHQGPMELSLVGDNLLHARHGEAAATGPLQEQYVRQVTARVTWRF